MPIWLTSLSAKDPVACPAKGQLANARLRILVHRRARHPLVSKPRPKSEKLPSPRGHVKTLPPTSLLSCVTLAARPGNWDPADHRGFRLGHVQYGSSGRTTLTLHEGSLLPAFRVSTPGLVSTATLPSVIRGGCYSDKSTNNNNDDDDDDHHDNDTDDENDDNNDNDNDNNNKVARASAAARGVSFILGGFLVYIRKTLYLARFSSTIRCVGVFVFQCSSFLFFGSVFAKVSQIPCFACFV